MKQAKISEVKDHLSHYLDYVREGETVVVMDRKMPIAKIIPLHWGIDVSSQTEEAYLRDLERRGIARVGSGKASVPFKVPHGKSAGVLAALLKERREGR